MISKNKLPKPIENVLWSYDLSQIDVNRNKKLIIGQILNFGTKEATDWMFKKYTIEDIRKTAEQIPLGQWGKKSLALWSYYLKIKPISKSERVLYGQ